MTEFLNLKESNCKNCHKCIRYCPVKAINFNSNQANIVQNECILCGECFVKCPQNAKGIKEDLPAAKELIKSGAPVYASIAPSFAANYGGASIDSMRNALTRLGFAGAEETAIGATIVKNQYDIMVREQKKKVIISSCCHTVNLLIQRYYHGALPFLANVLSPMQAHSKYIKKSHPNAKTIFIGPCISKKAEADQYPGIVDCVLTFEELTMWLEEEGIELKPPDAHDDSAVGKARLFPTTGGVLRTMDTKNDSYNYIAIDGVENCIAALEDILNGKIERCFIEMSACKGSCINGPVMEQKLAAPISSFVAVEKSAGATDFVVEMPEGDTLKKDIPFQTVHSMRPGQSAIDEVMRKMGKLKPSDELNCGTCGYNTCKEKAIAILAGKADVSMCLPYLMERAQSFSDTIISNSPNGILVLNESLNVQQINAAACGIVNVQNSRDVMGGHVACILDPTPFSDVVQSHRNIYERKVYLAEYRKYVMLTVIYDTSYRIIISLMRDVTDEQTDRSHKEEINRKTIEITDKVIEKQMRAVQEIASLLGETTAETKVALTKLKETLNNE